MRGGGYCVQGPDGAIQSFGFGVISKLSYIGGRMWKNLLFG